MGASAIFMLVRTIIKMKNDKIKLLNSIERKKNDLRASLEFLLPPSHVAVAAKKHSNQMSFRREEKTKETTSIHITYQSTDYSSDSD